MEMEYNPFISSTSVVEMDICSKYVYLDTVQVYVNRTELVYHTYYSNIYYGLHLHYTLTHTPTHNTWWHRAGIQQSTKCNKSVSNLA